MTRDLMFKDDIQQLVADSYRDIEDPGGPGTSCYDPDQLARLPAGARDWALGVGNPVAHAGLQHGERVLDIGCGAGIDVFLAAQQVGAAGQVTGVDMLTAMVERARAFATVAGYDNTEFVTAEMEDLPLTDERVDAVISNGAINLSARKSRVLAEAYRVLRPGGRLVVSDLTIREEELPAEVITHPSAWAG